MRVRSFLIARRAEKKSRLCLLPKRRRRFSCDVWPRLTIFSDTELIGNRPASQQRRVLSKTASWFLVYSSRRDPAGSATGRVERIHGV